MGEHCTRQDKSKLSFMLLKLVEIKKRLNAVGPLFKYDIKQLKELK